MVNELTSTYGYWSIPSISDINVTMPMGASYAYNPFISFTSDYSASTMLLNLLSQQSTASDYLYTNLAFYNAYLNNQFTYAQQNFLFNRSYNTKTNIEGLKEVYNSDAANKLINIADKNASGTIGECLGSIRKATETNGLTKGGAGSLGGEAWQAADKLADNSNFKEVTQYFSSRKDLTNAPAGCIIVFDKNRDTNRVEKRLSDKYGHIMVTRGDKSAVSDHSENLAQTINNYAGTYRVFVPTVTKKLDTKS